MEFFDILPHLFLLGPVIVNHANGGGWLDSITGGTRPVAEVVAVLEETAVPASDDHRVPSPRKPEGEKSAALR